MILWMLTFSASAQLFLYIFFYYFFIYTLKKCTTLKFRFSFFHEFTRFGWPEYEFTIFTKWQSVCLSFLSCRVFHVLRGMYISAHRTLLNAISPNFKFKVLFLKINADSILALTVLQRVLLSCSCEMFPNCFHNQTDAL